MHVSTAPHHPQDNRLFAALPREDAVRLLPHLTLVTWALGDVLYDPDRAQMYLYFPTTAMVSLLYTLVNGMHAEIGVIGYEGVVGLALFMGGASTPSQAIVPPTARLAARRLRPATSARADTAGTVANVPACMIARTGTRIRSLAPFNLRKSATS